MTPREIPSTNSPRSPRTLALVKSTLVVAPWLALLGCGDRGERLLVATSWPRAERARAARQFRDHWKSHAPAQADPPAIDWLVLGPDSDPARLLDRSHPPDVVLGPSEADMGRLADVGRMDGPTEMPIRAGRPILGGQVDPKESAGLMARVADSHPLYANLIRRAAGLEPIPAHPGGRHLEPVVVIAGSRNLKNARAFATALADPMNSIGRDRATESTAPAASFLAIMLESILLDAHDELALAGQALERASRPPGATAWLVEPPPWPPASVSKLLERPDQSGDALVLRLAESIVPDPTRRAALVRSWLEPRRPIDGALARNLAALADGSLLSEPRLRDWLRAEWTAWARQRFRRVARLAAGWTSTTPDKEGGKRP